MSAIGSRWREAIGPGFLVAAAFIGPGTVTTASVAGAAFGYQLAWAILFAILATMLLQEMAARLGLASGLGLGEAIRMSFDAPMLQFLAVGLVVLAIGFGNAAYQAGNITGAALGLAALSGIAPPAWALVVGALASVLLLSGAYRVIERLLIALVAVMGITFLATAALSMPKLGALTHGLIRPDIPKGGLLTTLALVGTTVVPYNLFLHSSAVQEKWGSIADTLSAVKLARRDTVISVGIGGLVTLAILVTAFPLFLAGTGISSPADMARQLEPLLGPWASSFFAVGLFAAGLTSAITAPLAAAYAVCGTFGWPADMASWRFRVIWGVVMLTGTVFAVLGTRPVQAIVTAQAANAVLLPLVAVFLLVAVNRRDFMGHQRNSAAANLGGAAVVALTALLGGTQLWRVFFG
jgi:manganese transport protein